MKQTMSRVLLLHWNVGEAKERAEWLRRAGFQVDALTPRGGPDLRAVRKNPPDAFVIDLGRIPSQGRDAAIWLRHQKATRLVPIVFVDGDPGKVARVRKLLPDAYYTEWNRIGAALRRALKRRPKDPVVPGMLEGYSGTPLPKKLGVRAGTVVALLGPPPRFERKLGALPENVRLKSQARGHANLIVLFVKSGADLRRRFPAAARALAEGGGLWIAWPKKASGVTTDLSQTDVRRFGLGAGFVDYKICAIDETWSGLLFARRRSKRR